MHESSKAMPVEGEVQSNARPDTARTAALLDALVVGMMSNAGLQEGESVSGTVDHYSATYSQSMSQQLDPKPSVDRIVGRAKDSDELRLPEQALGARRGSFLSSAADAPTQAAGAPPLILQRRKTLDVASASGAKPPRAMHASASRRSAADLVDKGDMNNSTASSSPWTTVGTDPSRLSDSHSNTTSARAGNSYGSLSAGVASEPQRLTLRRRSSLANAGPTLAAEQHENAVSWSSFMGVTDEDLAAPWTGVSTSPAVDTARLVELPAPVTKERTASSDSSEMVASHGRRISGTSGIALR